LVGVWLARKLIALRHRRCLFFRRLFSLQLAQFLIFELPTRLFLFLFAAGRLLARLQLFLPLPLLGKLLLVGCFLQGGLLCFLLCMRVFGDKEGCAFAQVSRPA
jgi:hypothetical protein